jgi:hypothetical protein
MSLIKCYVVANANMFYIRHRSDNFTIFDCYIPEPRHGQHSGRRCTTEPRAAARTA